MISRPRYSGSLLLCALVAASSLASRLVAAAPTATPSTVYATVVALDQPYFYNRLGAAQPGGMIFALAGDVVVTSTGQPINPANAANLAGLVSLRSTKRPRPIVLRVNMGQNLQITFINLLQPAATPQPDQVATRNAGFHVAGLELAGAPTPGINNDATWTGNNGNAYAAPGATTTYTYFARSEGAFYAYSNAADWNGQTAAGLFGTIIVEPATSEWYRSQITATDLAAVASYPNGANTLPTINYQATYSSGPRQGQPVLRMTQPHSGGGPGDVDLLSSDLTAIITGPNAGLFTATSSPDYLPNPTYPNRTQPFREFALMYHEIFTAQQAFPQFAASGPLGNVLLAGGDAFAINYGAAGIGAEVLANRLGVGPMGGKQSVDLKFEEFFLSSWANGDPAMIVDVPANANGTATKAFYPDDPANVYHSYMGDHVTMRVLHTGTQVTHVHHLHAHQWLRTPNDENSAYLDSQMIAPGSTYTMEIAHDGSGNLNETVGDSIFHCHFYPHFAAGMWGLWRVHDVFETGTQLDGSGIPVTNVPNRALPDAEIAAGTPIPAIVPLPTLGMAPIPAAVTIAKVQQGGSRAIVTPATTNPLTYTNPGYPFFIPGVSGHRAPHPPMDFAPDVSSKGQNLDGGLPRHLVLGGTVARELHTRWDFTKDFIAYDSNNNPVAGSLLAFQLPEAGTAVEQAAMAAHSVRNNPTFTPAGTSGNFVLNGQPAVSGAPFANPTLNANASPRVYQAAAIQTDVAFTKQGWHYPQQRMISLWGDVQATLTGARAPQPFFIRANSGDTVQFWHTNLVPDYYELDDFQVRTPTDIIGQHIHLVKFDVLASDGAGNGWNYEDGSFSPDEVRGRIDAINRANGLYSFDNSANQFQGTTQQTLTAKALPTSLGLGTAPAGQNWLGAQTTIQLWGVDPVTNNAGVDRTLRTVFTHDHFGPSTHQQIGLYGGLLVEPTGSTWFDPNSNTQLGVSTTRTDGGPTNWQANIITTTTSPTQSYREFALEFGDSQLVYTNGSTPAKGLPAAPLFTTTFPLPPGAPTPPPLPYTTTTYQVVNGPVPAPVSYAFQINGVTLYPGATIAVGGNFGQLSAYFILHNPIGSTGTTDDYKIAPVIKNSQVIGWQVFPLSAAPGWASPNFAINPPGVDPVNKNSGAPYPQMLSPNGTFVLNYRGEPLPARVWNPASSSPATGQQGDLAFAYASITRSDPLLNVQPAGTANGSGGFLYPPSLTPNATGAVAPQPTDPYTPILNAYVGDNVQVRTLVGSQSNPHFFSMDGVKWLYEPGSPNSGYRNNQPMGISEHFEMQFQVPAATAATPQPFADYLYNGDAGVDGVTGGAWGLLRAFKQATPTLVALPNNPPPASAPTPPIVPPTGATVRSYTIVATTAAQALGANGLIYNNRGQAGGTPGSPLINNPNAVLYFQAGDLSSPDLNGTLLPGHAVEPLILRACAGEWIQITLINAIDQSQPQFKAAVAASTPYGATATAPSGNNPIPGIAMNLSSTVGLSPQVVGYDITTANGMNVGFNPIGSATVAALPTPPPTPAKPNQITFYWYAGTLAVSNGQWVGTPIEFGGINLNPADPLLQHTQGLIGALIIEPSGATWQEDYNMLPASGTPTPGSNLTRAAATVTRTDGTTYRDFVLLTQDDVPLQPTNLGSTQTVNYGAEPMNYRYANTPFPPAAPPFPTDTTQATADSLVGGDPQTPIFFATPGSEVHFHMLRPAGGTGDDGETLTIDGHVFQEEPFINNSTAIGNNVLSQSFGTRGGHGARDRFEVILPSAGGTNQVPGDYLYRSTLNGDMTNGVWGIFRVAANPTAPTLITPNSTKATPTGPVNPSPIRRLRPPTKAPKPAVTTTAAAKS